MKTEPVVASDHLGSPSHRVGGVVIVPPGAQVQTREGLLPAEHLISGDDLVARDLGYIRLKHVSRLRQEVRTVWVQEGFLPGMAPEGGILLPSYQPVLRRDIGPETGLPAQAMASLGLAEAVGTRQLTLIQLWLPQVETIFAGGLELTTIPIGQPVSRVA
jgi:hypothetical protein